MHTISLETYSYKDLKEGFTIERDSYSVGGYLLTPERIKTYLECPFVDNDAFIFFCLARIDGVVVGRLSFFPIEFKAGNEVFKGNGGSSLFVHEDFRKYDVAVEIVMFPITNKLSNAIIYADFSKEGIDVYRALRFYIFSLKKLMLVRNSRFIFENYGLSGYLLRIATSITNIILLPINKLLNSRLPSRLKKYEVKEVSIVPEWVDEMVLNDGHKYMEIHDHRWLQWCLDNKFHDNPRNKNHFYLVFKEGSPYGFFMTKERYGGIESRNISPMLTGSLIEWGSKDESELSEEDLVQLSIQTFSKDIDLIQVFSDNVHTINKAKRLGFWEHGCHFIVYKDMLKRFKEAKDQRLWRLRFGYSDSVMN